ncbi:B3 domain-containing protein At3g19184-like isoform X2 [Cannabis sativa]|uniref:B3 domain-containing protein At3g19184-like isoform X2 n=1 Tax=Cannabis sativa TaxID=3483 RepID=UPI0029C9F6F3|nr:B3 domain-containing protein At3g19184-like isoform X2 [Cannabis sativa]
MVESKLGYEESRKQRLEENKKRMEDLNLTKLAQALKTPTPKSTPVKQAKPRARESSSAPLRRSNRVADKSPPNYKEDPIEPLEWPRSYYRSYHRKDLLNRVYASDEVRKYAIYRAEVLQSELDSNSPSFVKPMLQSHVTGGFWLGLPVQFCKNHLPHTDEMITLIDEEGGEFPTKYLVVKNGLSGGWRGFAIDHQLVDGDALVFHLVKSTQFKVYIIRANQTEDQDLVNEDEAKEENNKDLDDVLPASGSGSSRKSKKIRTTNQTEGQDVVNEDKTKKNNKDLNDIPSALGSTRKSKRSKTNQDVVNADETKEENDKDSSDNPSASGSSRKSQRIRTKDEDMVNEDETKEENNKDLDDIPSGSGSSRKSKRIRTSKK